MNIKLLVLAALCVAFTDSELTPSAAAQSAAIGQEPVSNRREFRVVGYLPNYRAAEFNADAARGLTDLIVFSAEPSPDGTLSLDRLKNFPFAKVCQFKTEHRVRLILCVGGWERSKNFPAVATSPAARQRFVNSAFQACLLNRLDGIDLDWEHPKTVAEQQGYADLLSELRGRFQEKGMSLSLTMAAWQKLPPQAFEAVDVVNIMAYDNQGQHSTLESAKNDMKRLLDQGVPAEKLVLGMPFYGRHVTNRREVLTYAEIVAKYHPAPEVDEVESLYFNGPVTIRQKTQFALDAKLGGVMFWELGQDAKGADSLLGIIQQTVQSQPKHP